MCKKNSCKSILTYSDAVMCKKNMLLYLSFVLNFTYVTNIMLVYGILY